MHRVLWERLDCAGHDSCRFLPDEDGWTITGAAVFDLEGVAASLAYRLECDGRWVSLRARVTGWVGARHVSLAIERQPEDRWTVDGQHDARFDGLSDIDLGFTPASNTNAMRRLALARGDRAETVALWLDPVEWAVKPLPQSYERLGPDAYAYTSPTHGYEATLIVDDMAAIVSYPGLWSRVQSA